MRKEVVLAILSVSFILMLSFSFVSADDTIMGYWNGEGGFGGPSGNDLVISLDEENLSNMELEIPLEMIYRNPFLREGTQLFFEVYWRYTRVKYSGEFPPEQPTYTIGAITLSGTRIKEEEKITATMDWNGVASAEFNLTGNDLYGFDYSLEPVFTFEVLYENRSRPTGASQYEQNRLFLTKKTGECSGAIPCNTFFREWECQEVAEENGADCVWDTNVNSCVGEIGVSCEIITDKDTCNLYECSWRADSVWERFTDWFRNLFGG